MRISLYFRVTLSPYSPAIEALIFHPILPLA